MKQTKGFQTMVWKENQYTVDQFCYTKQEAVDRLSFLKLNKKQGEPTPIIRKHHEQR